MWKDIPNWEEFYEVNEQGEVRNKRTGKFLVGDINNHGYHRVCLYNKPIKQRFFRHRLVAKLFIPNPYSLPQIDHIDGDKSNNCVENLEWVTQSENEIRAIKSGLKGVWNGYFKIVYDNDEEVIYDNAKQFARDIGLSSTTVRNWLKNRCSTYHKYGIKEIYYI